MPARSDSGGWSGPEGREGTRRLFRLAKKTPRLSPMPVPLHTQTVIAFIWDFDRTLIPDNMQNPIFDEYGVNPATFWEEVEGLVEYHHAQGEVVARDTAYLLHVLTYVEHGVFAGLTNAKLHELGGKLQPCPGIPEFFQSTRDFVAKVPEFAREGITVEHYIVSTGIRQMIEGSSLYPYVDGIWANSFVEHAAPPGYTERLPVDPDSGPIKRLGYVIDNTSKTRAIFEVNKGVNKNPEVDVNSRMDVSQRRVHPRAPQQPQAGQATPGAGTDPGHGRGRLPPGQSRVPLAHGLTRADRPRHRRRPPQSLRRDPESAGARVRAKSPAIARLAVFS